MSSEANLDTDVSEATAALKDLLGIGGGMGDGAEARTIANNRQGKKNKSKPRKQESTKPQQQQQSSAVDTVAGVGKTKRTTSKPRSNNSATTTPKQQRPPPAANNNNRTKGERGGGAKVQELSTTPPTENSKFAFSAFQASPDASLLPMPIFHRSTDDDATSNNELTSPPPPQDEQQQHRNEKGSSPDLSSLEDSMLPKAAAADLSLKPRQIQLDLPPASPAVQDEKNQDESSPITGINLASLESSKRVQKKSSNEHNKSSEMMPFDPVAALLNTGGSSSPPLIPKQDMVDNWSIPPYNTKYITIPVLIPPNLPPNRVIAVQAPPPAVSSPVYVQVPHHVVSGMVIPVQVPILETLNQHQKIGHYSQLPYFGGNIVNRQQPQPVMHHSYSTPNFTSPPTGFPSPANCYHSTFVHHDQSRNNPMPTHYANAGTVTNNATQNQHYHRP